MTFNLSNEQIMIMVVLIFVSATMGAALGYIIAPSKVEYTDPPAYNPAYHEHTQHGHLGLWLCTLFSLGLGLSRVVISK